MSAAYADVDGLANKTIAVRWYYIMQPNTGRWYIVHPGTGGVLMLDRVDQSKWFGIYWKPIHNYDAASSDATSSYANPGNVFSHVTPSADGRTISFGSALSGAGAEARSLADKSFAVQWFYVMQVPSEHWYIVSPVSAVLRLDRVDRNTSFGIYWKPIHNWKASASPSTMGYPEAGQTFTSVAPTANGRMIAFGAAFTGWPWLTFHYPVGADDGTGWLKNKNGLGFLERWDYGGACGLTYHPGNDFNMDGTSGDSDRYEPVYAVANGLVVESLYQGTSTWGNVILIEHTLSNGTKLWSLYGHLNDRWVEKGDSVKAREQIGRVGTGGAGANKVPAHLHFELRKQLMSATAFPCQQSETYVTDLYYNPIEHLNTLRQ